MITTILIVLQKYLSDEEFYQIFGMQKQDFHSMPKWKQFELKKVKKLF